MLTYLEIDVQDKCLALVSRALRQRMIDEGSAFIDAMNERGVETIHVAVLDKEEAARYPHRFLRQQDPFFLENPGLFNALGLATARPWRNALIALKTANDALTLRQLQTYLAVLGTDRLAVGGCFASICVGETMRHALNLGYDCNAVTDLILEHPATTRTVWSPLAQEKILWDYLTPLPHGGQALTFLQTAGLLARLDDLVPRAGGPALSVCRP